MNKKITWKYNLIFLGDFNVKLGNRDRSAGNKDFRKSQGELLNLITEFDLEDLWRRQNPNGHFYMHFHG